MWALLKRTAAEWNKHDAQTLGASIAYYTVLSLAPLLVIAVSICGMFFGDKAVRGQIAGQIQMLVGPAGGAAIESMLANARSHSAGIVASIIGFVVLLFGASGVFNALRTALNRIWDVPADTRTGFWHTLKQEFSSFAMVVGIGFLLLVSLLVSAGLSAVTHVMGSYVPGTLWTAVNAMVSLVVITALFALIFRFVPEQRLPWNDLWVGSFATAVLFTLGKLGLGLYLGKASVGSAYGAAGSLVVLLVWIYYSAQLFLFGAEFTRLYACHRGSLKNCGAGQEKAQENVPVSRPAMAETRKSQPVYQAGEAMSERAGESKAHEVHTPSSVQQRRALRPPPDVGPVKAVALGMAWMATMAGLGWWRRQGGDVRRPKS